MDFIFGWAPYTSYENLFSDSREDFVKAFLQYMGMLAILVMWPEQFV